MLIDWFTVGAQALNFLILVWLLKRYLYKPIEHAIDEREKRIAATLADADARKAEAQQKRDSFQQKNDELDRERTALLTQATEEAGAERQRLIDEARKTADSLSAKRQEALRSDAHALSLAIGRRTQREVFAIARKVLSDLATTSLEERMSDVFMRRLQTMDAGAKRVLAEALGTASAPAIVRTTFELPSAQCAAIKRSLDEAFATDVRVRFETTPDLVSGIELIANGRKVAWSIADYLGSMERGVGELLTERGGPPHPPVPATPQT